MSSMKRKQPTGGSSSKQPNKRPKSDASNKSKSGANKKDEAETKPTNTSRSVSSILANEQPAFPRGGAGLLTPLERKAIRTKASQDAVREQQNEDLFASQTAAVVDEDGDSDLDLKDVDPGKLFDTKPPTKKLKKRKGREQSKSELDGVRIEALSYKRLSEESILLGCVSAIGSHDLTLALPNGLVGYVSLASISAQFTAKVEAAAEEDNDDANEAEDLDVDLNRHFSVGQFLRVAVISLMDEKTDQAPSKKKIELSIDPNLVNQGLDRSSLTQGCAMQAAVVSIEDHGLVVDLGSAIGIIGFIPRKALDPTSSLLDFKVGCVFLCSVLNLDSNQKTVKLTPNVSSTFKDAASVNSFLPGALVDVLITTITEDGLSGKVMGLLDVTADMVHSGSYKDREAFAKQFQPGQKVKGRLISTFPLSTDTKLGFSILPHLLNLEARASRDIRIASTISKAKVTRVAPGLGVYFALPSEHTGFAHISRLSDKKIDSLSETSGAYKLESSHEARVLEYNPVDDLYILSLQQKVLKQPFLRMEDVEIGQVIKASVEKMLLGKSGVEGLILNLAEGVSGFVSHQHMSDVTLLHPEKKFREGTSVTARVLDVNKVKHQIRLTLKKTLVNSEQKIWKDFTDVSVGQSALGTLFKVDPHGALVQFYGSVRGFLPVSEMSEAYIKDASDHFKIGQVLNLYALNVDGEGRRLTVSAREPSVSQEADMSSLTPGSLTSGTIFEKSQSDVLLRLQESGAIARLSINHISDGSEKKRHTALEKFRVGQNLDNLLILDVERKGRLVNLCNRQSLIKAAKEGRLLKGFEDLRDDGMYTGYISNITNDGVFVRFASNITGLIPKRQVPIEAESLPEFGMSKFQPITAKVSSIDYRGATPRFWLTMRDIQPNMSKPREPQYQAEGSVGEVITPVDTTIKVYSDFAIGRVTQARITSIKETQINVELAKGVQGRVDVSEIFDNWEDIKDRKHPLKQFNLKQILPVRVLGAHDTRNHKFLPLSHRSSKNTVFELSARPSTLEGPTVHALTLKDLEVDQPCIVFVNNIADKYLMVNVTSAVRGRIRATDVSDDLSLAVDLGSNFPIGSAMKAKVTSIDLENNRLDLSSRTGNASRSISMDDLSVGHLLPGRITKISDRSIVVQLSQDLAGVVEMIDMADDYDLADPAKREKNEVVRVSVVRLDKPNKRIYLSMRPSRILSSKLEVKDPEVNSIEELEVQQVRRGFISNISDKGVFVTLGHGITGFVRVTNLSDEYLKDWKDHFQRDQLVQGKVIAVDKDSGHCQLSLKKSHVEGKYRPPITFNDLHVNDIVTGKIVKVESFGLFIAIDNSENVRGLCHRSEIAEKRIEDVSSLGFNEGDAVKAKVLKIESDQRRISFGLKASYFADQEDDQASDASDVTSGDEDVPEGVEFDVATNDSETSLSDGEGMASGSESEVELTSTPKTTSLPTKPTGLAAGSFDWLGGFSDGAGIKRTDSALDDNDEVDSHKPKKKKRRSEIQVDKTGDLDTQGPQSVDGFERLLLSEPDSAELWLRFIAFHIDLGDVDQAREIGERALKSIGISQELEKMTIWIALLNLENVYGDEESLEETFKRACEYMDPEEMHNKLISIYIRSGKHDKADELFQQMTKKFTQSSKTWVNYATFLFETKEEPAKARALLLRALQALPSFVHFDITSTFARLEFKTKAGVPEEGRTRFQGLINLYPKRLDLFNVMLDLEMQQQQLKGDNAEQIRQLFEQIFDGRKLKPGTAKKFFDRWMKFETQEGDQRRIEAVESRAAKWVDDYKGRNQE